MNLRETGEHALRIAKAAGNEANQALAEDDPKRAKFILSGGIRELREVKRSITEAEREVRADFQERKLKTSGSGQIIGAFGGAKARGAMSRARAAQQRSTRGQEQEVMGHFRTLKSAVDSLISKLDGAKFEVDGAMRGAAQAKKSAPRAQPVRDLPPPPPPVAGAWAGDPSGAHELRYFDGRSWTEHVADNGVTSTHRPRDLNFPPP